MRHRVLGGLGVVAGVVSAIALVLTPTVLPTGLLQRVGLTVADIWIATSAVAIAGGKLRAAPRPRHARPIFAVW